MKNFKLLGIFVSIIIIIIASYFVFKCRTPSIEKRGLIYKNCSFSYFKVQGIKDKSMFMSYGSKSKYKEINAAPKSLLVWYPQTETDGVLNVFHTQFGYKNIPLSDEAIKNIISPKFIKHFYPVKIELKYHIKNEKIELSNDGSTWTPMWIDLISSTDIKLDDSDRMLPFNKIYIITSWFEGEYEYIWDGKIN